MFIVLIVAAAAIVLIPGAPLGVINESVQALCGILLPMTTMFLLMLSNDRAVLGPWVNPSWLRALATVIVGVLVLLSVILTMSTIFPHINVTTLALAGAAVLAVVLAVLGLAALRSRRGAELVTVIEHGAGVPKEQWTMPPLALLSRPALLDRAPTRHVRPRRLHGDRAGDADRQVHAARGRLSLGPRRNRPARPRPNCVKCPAPPLRSRRVRRPYLIALLAACTALIALVVPAAAFAGTYTWRLPADFTTASPGSNPDHDSYGGTPWSYREGGTLLDKFEPNTLGGLAGWSASNDSSFVGVNPGTIAVVNGGDTFSPGKMALVPSSGAVAVEWQAPVAGTFRVSGTISAADSSSLCAPISWSFKRNGNPQASSGTSFSKTLSLVAGDKLDLQRAPTSSTFCHRPVTPRTRPSRSGSRAQHRAQRSPVPPTEP